MCKINIIFIVLVALLVALCGVEGDRREPTGSDRRVESKPSRGGTKFLLPQPTVKNKKYSVTSTQNTPVSRKETKPNSLRRKTVRKETTTLPPHVKTTTVGEVHEIQKFPSLAGLVFLEPSTAQQTKPTTTTTTTQAPRKRTTTVTPRKRAHTQPTPASKAPWKVTTEKPKKAVSDFDCPPPGKIPFQWFPLPCDSHKQCRSMGKSFRCCAINSNSYKTCTKGVRKEIPEEKHIPLFGVPIKCPKVPLAELFWNVQTCDTDSDCWPRVCCPDGRKKFCRSPNPQFKEAANPLARQLNLPFKSATSFIQCTTPSRFDLHPKPCNTTLDCFPNLCCQEGAKRHCRPPQRSLFSMVANSVSQTFFGQ